VDAMQKRMMLPLLGSESRQTITISNEISQTVISNLLHCIISAVQVLMYWYFGKDILNHGHFMDKF
jgi:hypothetical protein